MSSLVGLDAMETFLCFMALRDEFAAKALPAVYADAMLEEREESGLFQIPEWRHGLALDAYMMADAMLKAREQ